MIKKRKDSIVFEYMENKCNIPYRLLEVLKTVKEDIENNELDRNKNLLVYGNPGTGKTIYSLSIAYHNLKDIKIPLMSDSLVFITTSELLVSLKQYYKKSQSDSSYGIINDPETGTSTTYEERLINKCKHAKLLILDDFGIGNSTDWTNEILFSIINYRYSNANKSQSTIVTSNFDSNELSKRVDDRIVSRILDMCTVLLFKKVYRNS